MVNGNARTITIPPLKGETPDQWFRRITSGLGAPLRPQVEAQAVTPGGNIPYAESQRQQAVQQALAEMQAERHEQRQPPRPSPQIPVRSLAPTEVRAMPDGLMTLGQFLGRAAIGAGRGAARAFRPAAAPPQGAGLSAFTGALGAVAGGLGVQRRRRPKRIVLSERHLELIWALAALSRGRRGPPPAMSRRRRRPRPF